MCILYHKTLKIQLLQAFLTARLFMLKKFFAPIIKAPLALFGEVLFYRIRLRSLHLTPPYILIPVPNGGVRLIPARLSVNSSTYILPAYLIFFALLFSLRSYYRPASQHLKTQHRKKIFPLFVSCFAYPLHSLRLLRPGFISPVLCRH